jgi:hypothetical protein
MANVFGWPEPVPGQQPYLVALDRLVTAIDGTVASWWAEVRSAATTTVVISKPPPATDVSVPVGGSIVVVQSAGLVATPEPVRFDFVLACDLALPLASNVAAAYFLFRIWQGATLVYSARAAPFLGLVTSLGREQYTCWDTQWATLPPGVPLQAELDLFFTGTGTCFWPRSGPVQIVTMRPAPVGGW